MSHKATSWLASLPAHELSNSEFRVLFRLCDCHNPHQGCYPSQAFLMAETGISNGTLNATLRSLEDRGLIKRHQSRDGKTKRQMPTRYTLGFEIVAASDAVNTEGPSPKTGDGKEPIPDSKKTPKPSPKNGKSRLQPTGEEPVSKPVKNLREPARGLFDGQISDPEHQQNVPPENGADHPPDAGGAAARMLAEKIKSGRYVAVHTLGTKMLQAIKQHGVSDQELRERGAQ